MICLRCSHEWINRSVDAPKQCPKCKTYEWNAAPPPMLKCVKCSHEWRPRTGTPTEKCPGCKTKKWRKEEEPAPLTPESQAQLDQFNSIDIPGDPPSLTKCPKCGNEWQPRTDSPKQCPKCKARLDNGLGAKAEQRAKDCAARALAAVGPLAEEHIPNPDWLLPVSWMVCDWAGKIVGYVGGDLIIRNGLSDLDPAEHYPVIPGGLDSANRQWIEPELYGWVRREDVKA